MNKVQPSDSLTTADDFQAIKDRINRRELTTLVCELCQREPELAIGVAEQFENARTALKAAGVIIDDQDALMKRMSLLAWLPLLVLDRVHRRAWEGFLPSEEVTEETATSTPESLMAAVPDHDCAANAECRGILVALEVGMVHSVVPEQDFGKLADLIEQRGDEIAAQMIDVGVNTAIAFLKSNGGQK